MSQRPEALFPLFAEITGLDGVGPKTARALAAGGIGRPRDLLYTLPHGLIDRRRRQSLDELVPPEVATVEIEVLAHHPARGRGRPDRVRVRDAGCEFDLVFFHARGDWLARILPLGARRVVSGKCERFDGRLQMIHPDHIVPPGEADTIPAREPVYPLCAGVTQKLMFRATSDVLSRLRPLVEWIDPALLRERAWPDWNAALMAAHRPCTRADLLPRSAARERLAYDELVAHQATLALARARRLKRPGRITEGNGALQRKVLESLAYRETGAQARAVSEIAADMAAPHRMNRLLQGDVGSGKTLVALLALVIAVEAGGQGVLMAPTSVLAHQHLLSLRPQLQGAGVTIELLTGRDKGAQRRDKLGRLARGEIDILVGTHAVFQSDVVFGDLRLAVIDEQHRFGVRERMELGAKGSAVDVLVMTATPIPRSLALAQYGDMEVSVLDEKPPGRQPIDTVAMPLARLDEVVAHLRGALTGDARAYWVCPLVGESETVDWTAAQERFKMLRATLGEGMVGLVHGQMADADKDRAMADFAAGRTRVLVATTVIEVGVDVPEATIMVIEQAERFGLAQLHQLRGRVGRGAARSSCLLLYAPPLGDTAAERLAALRASEDGFFLAEEDLRLRGAGDVLGLQQSGLPKFRIADLETQPDLMAIAQSDARRLLQSDPGLASERGEAMRVLLYLMEKDKAFHMITVG